VTRPAAKPNGDSGVGYNFINSFSDRCAITGVLAGFAIAIASIVVVVDNAQEVVFWIVRFKDVAASLIGLAAVLFVIAMECFLAAKENNPWDLSHAYEQAIKGKRSEAAWDAVRKKMVSNLSSWEHIGRSAYNFAIIALFIGMGFAFYPFSPSAALLVAGVGAGFEIWQMLKFVRPAGHGE